MNQSLNVAVNYSNANKSIEMTPQEIGTGAQVPAMTLYAKADRGHPTAYVAATFTSVLLAVSLTRAVPRLPLAKGTKDLLARLVPFASVASAGVVKWVQSRSVWRLTG